MELQACASDRHPRHPSSMSNLFRFTGISVVSTVCARHAYASRVSTIGVSGFGACGTQQSITRTCFIYFFCSILPVCWSFAVSAAAAWYCFLPHSLSIISTFSTSTWAVPFSTRAGDRQELQRGPGEQSRRVQGQEARARGGHAGEAGPLLGAFRAAPQARAPHRTQG